MQKETTEELLKALKRDVERINEVTIEHVLTCPHHDLLFHFISIRTLEYLISLNLPVGTEITAVYINDLIGLKLSISNQLVKLYFDTKLKLEKVSKN